MLRTMRTAANSKVKILLRDDSIMTLAENSERPLTEFLLTPHQRRTIVSLTLGKLRVITTKIFGAGSVTEVRTANTVAGGRGTTCVVVFMPPDETEVIALDGVVAVRNPHVPLCIGLVVSWGRKGYRQSEATYFGLGSDAR